MRRFEHQETVMLVALCLVVMVVLFGATVAWYIAPTPASIENVDLNVDDLGDLYVWVKVEDEAAAEEGGALQEGLSSNEGINTGSSGDGRDEEGYVKLQEVGIGDDLHYSIDMNIVEQENIAKHTLAPGAYGEVKYKINSKTDMIKGYRITINPEIKVTQTGINVPEEDKLMDLVKSHIKFYAKYENGEYINPIMYGDECIFDFDNQSGNSGNQEDTGSYMQDTLEEINPMYTYRKGLVGEIEKDDLLYVTLYWYWPYEFVDIPECLNIADENSIFYEEFKKYKDKPADENIENYDWDDTYIGNYVTNLVFHFDVETLR